MSTLLPTIVLAAVPNSISMPAHTLQVDQKNTRKDICMILMQPNPEISALATADADDTEGGPDGIQVLTSSDIATAETIQQLPNKTFFSLVQKLLPPPDTHRKERSMLAETLLALSKHPGRPYADFLSHPEIIKGIHIAKVMDQGKIFFVVSLRFTDDLLDQGLNPFFIARIPASTDPQNAAEIEHILTEPLSAEEQSKILQALDIGDMAGWVGDAPLIYDQPQVSLSWWNQWPLIGWNTNKHEWEVVVATLENNPNNAPPLSTEASTVYNTPENISFPTSEFELNESDIQNLYKKYPTLFPTGIDTRQLLWDLAAVFAQAAKESNRVGTATISFDEQVTRAQQLKQKLLSNAQWFELGKNNTFRFKTPNGQVITVQIIIQSTNPPLASYTIK